MQLTVQDEMPFRLAGIYYKSKHTCPKDKKVLKVVVMKLKVTKVMIEEERGEMW
jgi:hypothetical protein